MAKIAPSILSADFSKLGETVGSLKSYGADLIHIDIMDGHFVPNITMGPSAVKAIRSYTDLDFDVHLMISNPDKYISSFVDAGADYITIHIESDCDVIKTIDMIKSFGKKAGISINPETPTGEIAAIMEQVDIVLIMSVHPGFGGQKFIDTTLSKIKECKEIIMSKNLNTLIEVDGGINLSNAVDVISAGADILVAGSSIFNTEDVQKSINSFKIL